MSANKSLKLLIAGNLEADRKNDLEFKCSAHKVQAEAQKVLDGYYGVLQSKRHMH